MIDVFTLTQPKKSAQRNVSKTATFHTEAVVVYPISYDYMEAEVKVVNIFKW